MGKWYLFASVFQLIIGVLAVAAFVVLWVGGEDMRRWIVTVLLSVAFAVMGISGIVTYCKNKNKFM